MDQRLAQRNNDMGNQLQGRQEMGTVIGRIFCVGLLGVLVNSSKLIAADTSTYAIIGIAAIAIIVIAVVLRVCRWQRQATKIYLLMSSFLTTTITST